MSFTSIARFDMKVSETKLSETMFGPKFWRRNLVSSNRLLKLCTYMKTIDRIDTKVSETWFRKPKMSETMFGPKFWRRNLVS